VSLYSIIQGQLYRTSVKQNGNTLNCLRTCRNGEYKCTLNCLRTCRSGEYTCTLNCLRTCRSGEYKCTFSTINGGMFIVVCFSYICSAGFTIVLKHRASLARGGGHLPTKKTFLRWISAVFMSDLM
jgi:hypothetical protein